MARKRYISTEISTDTKVAELSEFGLLEPLLFTWAIPHMDDWGRITGNAREFKLLVCPGLEVMTTDVDKAMNNIVKVGLWVRYEVDGKRCISTAHKESWFKHQSYISKDKRENDAGSSFPVLPQNAEERRETPKITEERRETPQNPSSFSLSSSFSPSINDDNNNANPFKIFESEGFGTLSSVIGDKIGCFIDTYGERWTCEAMKRSVFYGKRNLAYVNSILIGWKSYGIDEPWTLEKDKEGQTHAIPFRERGKQNAKYGTGHAGRTNAELDALSL